MTPSTSTSTVAVIGPAPKQLRRLPKHVQGRVHALVQDLARGAYQPGWSHYLELTGHRKRQRLMRGERRFHCHIHGYRWVAFWRAAPGRPIRVDYVGPHESAPYGAA